MNVTVRNIITSMRQISAIDWTELVERVSLVDALLRESGNFAEMDFATRDHYRKAIEKLSRGSHQPELEVTRRAIDAAETSPATDRTSASAIPATICSATATGPSSGRSATGRRRATGRGAPPRPAAAAIYIGGILLVAALIIAAMVAALAPFGARRDPCALRAPCRRPGPRHRDRHRQSPRRRAFQRRAPAGPRASRRRAERVPHAWSSSRRS